MIENMETRWIILCLTGCVLSCSAYSQNLQFSGQASAWGNVNDTQTLPLWVGGRYLPQVNYQLMSQNSGLIDFEASANINGAAGMRLFKEFTGDGQLKPYRLWGRYSTNQMELRAGLQKINFGSATLLRPLMWFDQTDPRDPLRLTDGVWGILGRYYFLNNANIWLWVLYGNDQAKTWEMGETSNRQPEWGGRFQMPLSKGEIALSFHHRLTDTRSLPNLVADHGKVPENRIGIDGKWDVGPGLWFESVWMYKTKTIGNFTKQFMFNIGADYTFGVGNGLTTLYEHLIFSYGSGSFRTEKPVSFSALSMNYPVGVADNVSATVYYDWNQHSAYNLVTWQHDFQYLSFYIMAYINPKTYQIPIYNESNKNLFAGNGIQLMLVYNH